MRASLPISIVALMIAMIALVNAERNRIKPTATDLRWLPLTQNNRP